MPQNHKEEREEEKLVLRIQKEVQVVNSFNYRVPS
jgi:hypothetical protein